MSNAPAVRVNRKAADRIYSGHPWIFSSDVLDRAEAKPGDVVRVIDNRGKSLGMAHYSSTSQIVLRLLTRRVEEIDGRFIEDAIARAARLRERVAHGTTAYRLVYGEADLLPGLVVDRYGDFIALQTLTQGMARAEPLIIEALRDLLRPAGIIARNDVAVRSKEDLPQEIRILDGEVPDHVAIEMNGLHLRADLHSGQKTGIFLDQRENYLASKHWARGRALDCFTGSGGFALHLASACESVEAVDASAAALASAKRNGEDNRISNVDWREANVLDYLPGLVSAHRRFDIIVVDPPAFTKSRSAIEGAARGYKEINLRALRLLNSGGILVSCSCSHHMSEARLLEIIAQAALDAGKQLRVLERRMQAQDHPVLLTVPETLYLKCLIFQVL